MQQSTNILQDRPQIARVAFLFVYTVFVYLLILYIIQNDLIFHPDRDYISPQKLGIDSFQEAPLQTQDGSHIMTWMANGDEKKSAILFLHGNSGQLAQYAPQLLELVNHGHAVLMMEYRGFGNTSGVLREDTVLYDAMVSYDFLKRKGYQDIIVMGYSFGSAPAVALSNVRPVSAVILLAPFTSMEEMAADSWFPFARYVLKDTYSSDTAISSLSSPLLIMHGKHDAIVPYSHSERLYQLARTPHKTLSLLPNGTHGSLFFSGQFIPKVLEFIE